VPGPLVCEVIVSADEEVKLSVTMRDDISATLEAIEQRLAAVEREALKMGAAGKVGGEEFSEGMDKAKKSTDGLGESSKKASPPVEGLGSKTEGTGKKSKKAADDLDKFIKKMDKMGKSAGGLGKLLTFYKFAAMATGLFAAAGGLSALAAGAVMLTAHVAPLLLNLLNLGPIALAAALSMSVFKLTATQLSGPLTRIKQQFTDISQEVADGGIAKGLDNLASSMRPFVDATGKGLTLISAELGTGATQLGKWTAQASTIAYLNAIFAGLAPIVRLVIGALLSLLTPALALIKAIIPASQLMAAHFADTAGKVGQWVQAMSDSGKVTAVMIRVWLGLEAAGHAVWNMVVALFNIFHIAYGVVDNFGGSFVLLSERFRAWTESAKGQQKITKYFQDALPALHEMNLIIQEVLKYFGGLAGSMNVAPLLAQIRVELLPAIFALLDSLTKQDGLGPVLIDLASDLALLFSGTDFSGFMTLAKLADDAAGALLWMQHNVPGANFLISTLLFSLLGFKVLGPVWAIIGDGAKAFKWMREAQKATEDLTIAQKAFQGAMSVAGTVGKGAISGLGSAFSALGELATSPIGLIILAIIAVIAGLVLLYMKCEWFRNLVNAIWEAISTAAVAAWNWIVMAIGAAIDWIVMAAGKVGSFFAAVWQGISDAFNATVTFIVGLWNTVTGAIVTAFNFVYNIVASVVNAIVVVIMWIWTYAVQPVLSVIQAAFSIAFSIISFIVQTAVYIIVGIIVVIAITLKAIWDGIVWVAKWAWQQIVDGANWLWNTGIKPIIDFFVKGWNDSVKMVSDAWNWVTAVMSAEWNLFYTTYIKPVIDFIVSTWDSLTKTISDAWNWVTAVMSAEWNLFYTTYIQPVIQGISDAWNWLTSGISSGWQAVVDFIGPIWQGISDFISNVIKGIGIEWDQFTKFLSDTFTPVGNVIGDIWDGIKKGADAVVDGIKGAWNGLMDIVKGVWNFIAKGWNSIPDIHVPDWIPVIGGETFSLPKLPTLWHGGETPGGMAIVGEHGPEPIVRGGMVTDIVGQHGPELRNLPRGGYVVPNLNTLKALPGLTKALPAGIAAAVARSVPGYADLPSLDGIGLPPITVQGRDDKALTAAVRELSSSVREQRPPISVQGGDTATAVLEALRRHDRERALAKRYDY
jgi:phage-related protein